MSNSLANSKSDSILVTYPDGDKITYTATAAECCEGGGGGGGTVITDATAIAADLRLGKTAYNNDGKFTGTIATYSGAKENR